MLIGDWQWICLQQIGVEVLANFIHADEQLGRAERPRAVQPPDELGGLLIMVISAPIWVSKTSLEAQPPQRRHGLAGHGMPAG